MKKIVPLIILISFHLVGKDPVYSRDKFDTIPVQDLNISEEEFTKRKQLLLSMQNEVLRNLKNINSLSCISKYLISDFSFSHDFMNKLPDENACTLIPDAGITCHSTDEEFLKKIDRVVDARNIIYVIEKGYVNIGSIVATSYLLKSDYRKFPFIDYEYNEKQEKWYISAIRFVKVRD